MDGALRAASCFYSYLTNHLQRLRHKPEKTKWSFHLTLYNMSIVKVHVKVDVTGEHVPQAPYLLNRIEVNYIWFVVLNSF